MIDGMTERITEGNLLPWEDDRQIPRHIALRQKLYPQFPPASPRGHSLCLYPHFFLCSSVITRQPLHRHDHTFPSIHNFEEMRPAVTCRTSILISLFARNRRQWIARSFEERTLKYFCCFILGLSTSCRAYCGMNLSRYALGRDGEELRRF